MDFLHSPNLEKMGRGTLLGYLSDGASFHLPVNSFGYHFAFYGVTGSGKTRLAMKLAIEAENSGIKALILDVEGEWKNIMPYLKGKTEYYSTERNLKINPFELGDYGLIRLLLKETIFKGIEVEYQELSPQMNYVLDKCILKSQSIPELIDNVMYYEGEDLPFKLVNLDRTKTALLVRLEPYKVNPVLKEIFYCNNSSLDLNKLDDRNIVFDLHSLEAKVAYRVELRLLYNAIATAYLKQALNKTTSDKISNMFIADEAQLLAPRILRKLVVTDTWTTTEFATRLRKRGLSMVIISQSPSNIEEDIRKNCQNNFYFRIQDSKDIELIARSLGYNWYTSLDYFTHYINSLQQRQAIVKTPLFDEPFIIEAPEVFLRSVSKKEIKAYMPKIEFSFNEDEQAFLESINTYPFISRTERKKLLGWDKGKYREVVERLKELNSIAQVSVPLGKKRPLVLYQLKGKKPSIKHEFYVYWIIKQLTNKGMVCRAEKIGPDIQIPALKTAINVELGTSDIEKNIRTALEQFDRVIVCSDNLKILKGILEQIKLKEGKKVFSSLIWNVPSFI